MKPSTRRLIVLAGVFCGAAVVYVAVVLSLGRSVEREGSSAAIEDRSQWMVLAAEGTDRTIAAVGVATQAVIEQSSVGVPNGPEPLVMAVEGALRGYLGETFDPWIDYLMVSGVEPPSSMLTDPVFADKLWKHWHDFASSVAFDPTGIVVRRRASNAVPPVDHGTRTATRPGSRPSIESIPESSRTTVEVVIPASFRDSEGVSFSASLGLEFALSPDGDWILMRASLYDVPNGVVVPGLRI